MGVSPRIVQWLRDQGHDALHLREQGLQRMPDEQVFAKAAAESRIILTFDLDFGEIVASTGNRHVSVVVFRVRDTRTDQVIVRLRDVLSASSEALLSGSIVVVEDQRYRVRRLPILGRQDV